MKAMLVINVPESYGEITDNKATVNLKNWKLDTSLYICNVPVRPYVDDENEALRLLLNWAEECDFGYDNFSEEYERYKKDVENMDYIEGMIYIARKVIEEKKNGNQKIYRFL